MKTTERFERSATKLYNAFNNGTLDAMDCKHCAVGNLCNNSQVWKGNIFIGSKGRILKEFKNNTGYSSEELQNIEALFVFGSLERFHHKFSNNISNWEVEDGSYTKKEQQDLQFKGLMAVLDYLAELDNIKVPQITVDQFENVLV